MGFMVRGASAAVICFIMVGVASQTLCADVHCPHVRRSFPACRIADILRGPGEQTSSFLDVNGSDSVGALVASHTGRKHLASFLGTRETLTLEADASEVQAEAAMASVTLRHAIKTSHTAAQKALSAARVALWTEAIAAFGTTASVLSSWVGFKMDEARLPSHLAVPRRGPELPPELVQPPPAHPVRESVMRDGTAPSTA